MNSKTHKVVIARYYSAETIYAVPIDWNVDEIYIRYGNVYYKGEEVELPSKEFDGDSKEPRTIEEADDYDLEEWFDCEEEEEEEEYYGVILKDENGVILTKSNDEED